MTDPTVTREWVEGVLAGKGVEIEWTAFIALCRSWLEKDQQKGWADSFAAQAAQKVAALERVVEAARAFSDFKPGAASLSSHEQLQALRAALRAHDEEEKA